VTTADTQPESRPFEADVARLLHLMVHSVYSDRDIFIRELISNAADACEKLRYEALSAPELLGDDPQPRIVITLDAENKRLIVADNGIGMSHDEMVEALASGISARRLPGSMAEELGRLAHEFAARA